MRKPTVRLPRVYVLTATLIVLVGITAVLLPTDPLIAARLSNLQHHSAPIAAEKFNPDAAAVMDIPLKTILPEDGAGKAIRTHLQFSPKGCLVVRLGNCASCIRFDFAAWQAQADALHVPLVGFSGANPPQIAEFRRAMKITAPIYFDEHNAFSKAINSYWNGRLYYFDSKWHLAWRMEGFGNPNNLERQPGLKELLGGGK